MRRDPGCFSVPDHSRVSFWSRPTDDEPVASVDKRDWLTSQFQGQHRPKPGRNSCGESELALRTTWGPRQQGHTALWLPNLPGLWQGWSRTSMLLGGPLACQSFPYFPWTTPNHGCLKHLFKKLMGVNLGGNSVNRHWQRWVLRKGDYFKESGRSLSCFHLAKEEGPRYFLVWLLVSHSQGLA